LIFVFVYKWFNKGYSDWEWLVFACSLGLSIKEIVFLQIVVNWLPYEHIC